MGTQCRGWTLRIFKRVTQAKAANCFMKLSRQILKFSCLLTTVAHSEITESPLTCKHWLAYQPQSTCHTWKFRASGIFGIKFVFFFYTHSCVFLSFSLSLSLSQWQGQMAFSLKRAYPYSLSLSLSLSLINTQVQEDAFLKITHDWAQHPDYHFNRSQHVNLCTV